MSYFICPQCEGDFSTADALLRHRQVAHHNVLHPCECKKCGETFPTWKELRKHQVIHEPQDRESQDQGSPILSQAEVSALYGDVHVPEAETRTRRSRAPRAKTNGKGSIYTGIVFGVEKIPNFRCESCLKTFRNQQRLEQHREKKGHVALLPRQSRYGKASIGDKDASE